MKVRALKEFTKGMNQGILGRVAPDASLRYRNINTETNVPAVTAIVLNSDFSDVKFFGFMISEHIIKRLYFKMFGGIKLYFFD
jgi:hypothetical protein